MADTLTETRPTRRPSSPAAHLADRFAAATVDGERGVSVREVPFLTMVGVRAGAEGAAAIAAALGFPLPEQCGATGGDGDLTALWLSPDEFLLVADPEPADAGVPGRAAAVVANVLAALDGRPGSATDLSANRTTFELAGPSAAAVLDKGCALDLHPRRFPVGDAYLSLVGAVPVIVWKVGEQRWRVLPRASYADFLGRWLVDAMVEFGEPQVP